MPIGLVPALIMGAAAGGNVAGAVISSKASKHASEVQQAGDERALALQRQMYEEAKPRYQPYQDLGTSVLPTLRSLAGNVQAPRYGTNLSQLSIYGQQPPAMAPTPVGAGQTPDAAANGGGMVMMRAPNGQQKAVPREQVSHYQAQGAQIVSQ